MRIVFMGTPEFAVPSLEHLILNHYQVVAVYTQPDRPAGRGRALVSSPVKEAALRRQLPVVTAASLKSAEAVSQLADLRPDVIVVAAFGQILPQSVLDIPSFGCINVHPSLLPKYKGLNTHARAIEAGDSEAGCTVHLVTPELDSGPIVLQARVPVLPDDSPETLATRVLEQEHRIYPEAIRRFANGEL